MDFSNAESDSDIEAIVNTWDKHKHDHFNLFVFLVYVWILCKYVCTQ